MIVAKYDVLDVRYSDGSPAILRHVDGGGFAYYQSGRKAICVVAHGVNARGNIRRYSAIVHDDGPRSPIVGAFDDWGRGYADGQLSPGDVSPPKLVVGEAALTVVDGSGQATNVPLGAHGSRRTGADATGGAAGSADVMLRLNGAITLQHRAGRTSLQFQSAGVSHTFILGEMQGEEVAGMSEPAPRSLAEETARQLGETTLKLAGVCEKVSALKVDPTQKDARKKATFDANSLRGPKDLKDILDSLTALTQSLAQPGLAPADMKWSTEGGLKKMLAATHPQCPGQDRKNWSIARVSGKCTEERLANAKPTVATPKTVTLVSQLKLPELIQECAQKGQLLVVVCLASYAQEQSNYAKLVTEKAHTELWQKYAAAGGPPPLQLVAVELAEISGFADRYGIREVPYCLMFQGGCVVHAKRLRGMRLHNKDAPTTQPRVLLVEPLPAQQLKLERSLRRSGCTWDLSMDGTQALRLVARPQRYDAVLMSTRVRPEQQQAVASAVRRLDAGALVMVFDRCVPAEHQDTDTHLRFLEECSHVFPYTPSYAALQALLARADPSDEKRRAAGAAADKQEFLSEVLNVLQRGRGGAPAAAEGT